MSEAVKIRLSYYSFFAIIFFLFGHLFVTLFHDVKIESNEKEIKAALHKLDSTRREAEIFGIEIKKNRTKINSNREMIKENNRRIDSLKKIHAAKSK